MRSLFISPRPKGDGGPSLAVRRLLPLLSELGYCATDQFWSNWDLGLINVGGGRYGPAGLLCRRPLVYRSAGYYVRDIFNKTGRPWNWRYESSNLLTGLYLRLASCVIFQSTYARDILIDKFGQPKNYVIAHNAVDLRQYHHLERKENSTPVIASVGKMRHERIHDLIRVSQAINSAHQLLIVGSLDENGRKSLFEYGNRRGIAVTVSGFIPSQKLIEFYRRIDVLLHLAAADICPNVVVEAVACGVPVVCHAYGGTKEIVGDGGIAVSGEPYLNEDAFIFAVAESTQKVLTDLPAFRKRAVKQAAAQLDIRKTAEIYLEAFQIACNV